MIRRFRSWTWPILLVGIVGCQDNIALVQRDYYNVKHEILDNMVKVVDENSATRFNQAHKDRLKPKEDANKERFEKIKNNLYAKKDREDFAEEYKTLNSVTLKGQRTSGHTRLFQNLNRIRRVIVKMVDVEAEQAKKQGQSFRIESGKLCPNMTSLDGVSDFANMGDVGNAGGGGGGMMMMPGMMPGMGGPPGAPGAGQAAAAPAEEKTDPRAYQSFQFVYEGTKTGDPANPWAVNRSWRAGSGAAPPLVVPINGKSIDLLPLSSTQ